MSSADLHATPSRSLTDEFSRLILADFIAKNRPHRSLCISAGDGALDDDGLFANAWTVRLGEESKGEQTALCHLDRLPFQSRSFDLVVVQHVLSEGGEAALPELNRVLKSGGHLLALGTGRWSSRARASTAQTIPVAMRPARLCLAMKSLGLVIESCEGMGMMGVNLAGRGWTQPLVVFNDEVVICARRHVDSPIVRPLRFAQPRAVGARSTAMEVMRREELKKEAVA